MSRQANSPPARSIDQIQCQGNDRANDEDARKQHKGYEQFLHKVDLQSNESSNGNPQPLSSFSLAEYLTDLHWDGPLLLVTELDAIRRPEETRSV
jgi:hypothetical protein